MRIWRCFGTESCTVFFGCIKGKSSISAPTAPITGRARSLRACAKRFLECAVETPGSQALPGNPLFGRLCLPNLGAAEPCWTRGRASQQSVPRQSLRTRVFQGSKRLFAQALSQYRLAKDTSVPPRRINEIVRGTRSISADTALRLARYFGTSDRFWLNLQARYDLEVEKDRLGDRLDSEVKILEAKAVSWARPGRAANPS